MTPTVALVVISDRRDLYLPRCLASLDQHLRYRISQTVIIDDPDHRFTASGAVREGWAQVDGVDFILHVEEDFVFTEPIDIGGMAAVLEAEPKLANLVLLRQSWSQPEYDAGGIIPLYADHMTDRVTARHPWVQHDRFFSLNPCLVPRRVYEQGFPEGSEPAMTELLLEQGYTFGYWGARNDPPRCIHIGGVRAAGSVR